MAAGKEMTVQMTGGGPWGFRLYGGDDEPVIVAKMRKRSKAADAGLEEDDALLGINGSTCQGISHSTAMSLIEAANDLTLRVLRGVTDKHAVNAAIQALGSQLRPVPASAIQASYQAASGPSLSSTPGYTQVQPTALSQAPQQVVNGYGGAAPQTSRQEQTYREGDATTHVSTETSQHQVGGTTVTKVKRETFTQFGQKPMFNAANRSIDTSGPKPGVWSPSGMTVNAPSGVHVQHNPDQSVTMTIGMNPVMDDSKENIAPQKAPVPPMFKVKKFNEKAESFKPKLNMWNPAGAPAAAGNPQPMDQSNTNEITLLPDEQIELQAHLQSLKNPYPPHLQKVLFEGSGSDREGTPDSPGYLTRRRKKVFADSAFYDDPQHKYPTIEEQVKMARKVAMSLLAPANKKARGHRMFMRRMVKSQKWTTNEGLGEKDFDFVEEDEEEKYYNPNPWGPPQPVHDMWQPTMDFGPQAIPAPPPMPTNLFTAPTLPSGPGKEEKAKSLSAEEFERMRLMEAKTDHTGVSPAMCFSLAEDLRKMKGKGGKLFAKRVARAEKWAVDDGPEGVSKPNPELIAKIQMQAAAEGAMKLPGMGGPLPGMGLAPKAAPRKDGAPVNRLKNMIDPPKPKMTPWDSAAQYDGNTEKAFEHLVGYNPYGQSKKNELASALGSSVSQKDRFSSSAVTAIPNMPTSGQPAKMPDYTRKIKPWGASSGHGPAASGASHSSPMSTRPVAPSGAGFRPVGFSAPVGGASSVPVEGFTASSDGGAASFGGGEEVGYCDL